MHKYNIILDYSRDNLLTDFAKILIRKSYLNNTNMTYQEFFAMIASQYSDDGEQAQYMYDIISKLYFLPATPTLANGKFKGTDNRVALPISCFLNEVQNSKISIQHVMNETMCVANGDGGIGTCWSNLGSTGEDLDGQKSWGIMPFIKMSGEFTRYFGGMCRKTGSGCAYLHITHPQIEEFISSRKAQTGHDATFSLSRHIHIGVLITNDFISRVENGEEFQLISPITKEVVKTVDARVLWRQLLSTRVETGEPFMIFIDNVNNARPEILKKLNIKINTSNLCTEIMLPTGLDHKENNRTSICCLGSVNLMHFNNIKNDKKFFYYVGKFLDNVRLDFIARAPESLRDGIYATKRDGSIGLGISGLGSYFQEQGWEYGSQEAREFNKQVFQYIRTEMNEVSYKLACERGPCEDGKETGIMERFTHKIALKPDALTSYIFNVSSNVEPMAPAFMYSTMYGNYLIKNPILEKLLMKKGLDMDTTWNQILACGSISTMDIFSQEEKKIFRSPYEEDQMTLVQMAGDRSPYICQGQSLNLFLQTPIDAVQLHQIHMYAARNNIKSLYYLRTKSKFTIENEYTAKELKMVHNNIKNGDKISMMGNVCVGCD